MILLCYDGSADAGAAIEHAGKLLSGQAAIVLTVWEPFIEVMTRTSFGLGMAAGSINIEEIDTSTREAAQTRAQEGTELAQRVGLDAQPRTRSQVTTVAAAILDEADDLDASAIIVGSRGLTGLKSLMLGSVSHAVSQHADRTVIVVPSVEVAAARANRS